MRVADIPGLLIMCFRMRLSSGRFAVNAIPKPLPLVLCTRINGLQRLPHPVDEAHHGAAREFGLRGRVRPHLFRLINRDVVPYNAATIMLSHRVREDSI